MEVGGRRRLGKTWWDYVKRMRKVLVCPMRMDKLRTGGEGKLWEQAAKPDLAEKWLTG